MNNPQNIVDLIKLIDDNFSDLNGAMKVSLLRTVASYYENLTTAEATVQLFKKTFDKM